MNCGRCRRPLQEEAQWCSFCGTPVAATEPPRTPEAPATDPYATAPLPDPPAPAPPPPVPQPVYAPPAPPPPSPPAAGSAIAALVFSVFGLLGPLWLLGPLLALGFARKARREIAEAGGALGGWQVARAARILAWTSLVLFLVFAALFVGVLALTYAVGDSFPGGGEGGGLFQDGGPFSSPAP